MIHRLENLQVQHYEAQKLKEFVVHPEFASLRDLHVPASYSGMIFQPMRPWSLCMNVVWIMRFIQAPASPISI